MPSSNESNYLNTKICDSILKGQQWTPPTAIWVALFTTVPNLDGTTGVEVSTSGTGYARQQIQQGSGWTGPAGNTLVYSNTNDIVFDTPTANWGTIRGVGMYDAQVDGNLLYAAFLNNTKPVSASDNAPRIPAGQLRIARATC